MKCVNYLLFACASVIAIQGDAWAKETLLLNTKNNIDKYYVMSENIPVIKASLDDAFLKQTLLEARSKSEKADILTQHLQQFDKHFAVQHVPKETVSDDTNVLPKKEPWFSKLARNNAGFRQVSIMPGNVGVVEFWGFASLNAFTKKKIHAAMTMLEDVDALIIDLRENGGGSGETVSWLTSYFTDGRIHLNSFYTRYTDTQSRFYTDETVTNHTLQSVPIYILIGPNTFSAAEEFAYNLKHLKRATVIGMPSKGGANPWAWFSLNDEFRIGIPTTKAINPITNTNWEGKGVQPHVKVNASQALERAHTMALEVIAPSLTNEYQKQEVEALLGEETR